MPLNSREEAIRQIAEAREYQARLLRGQQEPKSGFLRSVAEVGAVVGLGYAGLKSEGALRLMGRISEGLHDFIQPFRNVLAGPRAQNIRFSNFDLLADIKDFRSVTDAFTAHGGGTGILGQEISRAKTLLQNRFAGPANIGGLRRMTAGDLMRDPARFSAHSRQQIEWGLQQGLISSETPLTRGAGGLTVDRVTGRVVDARTLNPRFFLRNVYEHARSIQVPFFGVRPADIIAAPLKLFTPRSAQPFAGVVRSNTTLTKGVRTPDAFSYVLGGELLSYTPQGFRSLTQGLKLGTANSVAGQTHLQRYGLNLTPEGFALKARIQSGGRGGVLGFIDSVQQITGIGPAHRTKDQAFVSMVLNPLRRREHGEIFRAPNVSRADNRPFFRRFIDGLADQQHAQAQGLDFQAYSAEAVPNTTPLSWLDKVKAYFGASRRAYVVRKGLTRPPTHRDLVAPSAQGQGFLPGYHATTGVTGPGIMGAAPTGMARNQYYAYGGGIGEAVADAANMFTNRLNDLIGWTTGLGFRPTTGQGTVGGLAAAGVNVAKIYGMFSLAAAGVGYLTYADHLAESITGVSPKKLLIGSYAGARLGQQTIREGLGIAPAARYLEDLMPKSVDSGASWLARTVLPLVAGAAKGGYRGLAAGAVVSGAIGGSGLGQSPGELLEEYKGERLVPIRKSRFWLLGRSPWEGGQVDYYAPGWVARELSDYKYTDTLYGSKADYFRHVANIPVPLLGSIPLPTPHNLFGLSPLVQGDFFGGGKEFLAQKHRFDRPYPDSPGVDSEEAAQWAQFLASRGPFDPPLGAGQRLGMGTVGSLGVPPKNPAGSLTDKIGDAVDRITELGGIYKFLAWDLPGFSDRGRPKLANSSDMNDSARAFADEQLGGAFGMSELYRRLVPTPDKTINPVPNNMPGWLPGLRSDYVDDRQYHVDFTLGDPYAKLKMGEFRLPGKGYESLHRLHSGSPGIYDAMDRFLILSDVAPHSRARKEYQAIVEGWSKAGVLDAYWSGKLETTKEQIKKRMERFEFTHRRFTGLITDPDPEGTRQKYNPLEKGLGAGWEMLTHDLVPALGATVPLFGPLVSDKLLVARSPIEQYMHNELYGEEFADWKNPWEAFLRPKLNVLTAANPIVSVLGGMGMGTMGATPMAGLGIGLASSLFLGTRSLTRELTGETYIPQHRQQEWELQEYFDNLRYLKSMGLSQQAEQIGDNELANYYNREMKRTVSSINYGAGPGQYISASLKALPRSMRSYFLPFMQMPTETQRHILPYMPEHIQPVFAASWAKAGQAPPDIGRFDGVFSVSPQERVAGYFSANQMPGPDSPIWHPDIPLDAVKIRMVDSGANSIAADIHKFELFPEHRFRASRFANIPVPDVDNLEHPEITSSNDLDLQRTLERAGFSNVNIRPSLGPSYGSGMQWGIKYDNMPSMREVIRRMTL
jgi:hypothetical protein